MEKAGLSIQCAQRGAVYALRLEGFLDAHTAPTLDQEIQRVLAAGCRRIVVNLAGLNYISSAGLGVFMSYVETLRDRGGDLRLCALIPKVRRVFDIVGFSQVFELFDEEERAVQAFEVEEKAT